MTEVRSSSIGSVRLSHGAVAALAFVAVMMVSMVTVVTSAAGADGEGPSSAATTTVEYTDMYTAMANIAAALATLPPLPPPTPVALRQGQTRPAVVVDPSDPGVWDALAHCETRGNWATELGTGFAGGLQFANGTWTSNGGAEFADSAADATREQQIEIAQRVLAGSGWGAWPGCSSLLGLR